MVHSLMRWNRQIILMNFHTLLFWLLLWLKVNVFFTHFVYFAIVGLALMVLLFS